MTTDWVRVASLLRELARLGLALADELDPPRRVTRRPPKRLTDTDRAAADARLVHYGIPPRETGT